LTTRTRGEVPQREGNCTPGEVEGSRTLFRDAGLEGSDLGCVFLGISVSDLAFIVHKDLL